MRRASPNAITGWRAWLLVPVVLPLAFLTRRFSGNATMDRSPQDVAGFLRDFIAGEGGDWDWDEFESVPITDPVLDHIRTEAACRLPGPEFGEACRASEAS